MSVNGLVSAGEGLLRLETEHAIIVWYREFLDGCAWPLSLTTVLDRFT